MMGYLLDTNILLMYVRGNQAAYNLEKELSLLDGKNDVIISIVSVGEIKSLAIQNNWGSQKLLQLDKLLNRFLIADINVDEITDRYAEIDAFSQGNYKSQTSSFTARNMGKNDLWIAATSSVLNLTLITIDKDFEHLDKVYLNVKAVKLSH